METRFKEILEMLAAASTPEPQPPTFDSIDDLIERMLATNAAVAVAESHAHSKACRPYAGRNRESTSTSAPR